MDTFLEIANFAIKNNISWTIVGGVSSVCFIIYWLVSTVLYQRKELAENKKTITDQLQLIKEANQIMTTLSKEFADSSFDAAREFNSLIQNNSRATTDSQIKVNEAVASIADKMARVIEVMDKFIQTNVTRSNY